LRCANLRPDFGRRCSVSLVTNPSPSTHPDLDAPCLQKEEGSFGYHHPICRYPTNKRSMTVGHGYAVPNTWWYPGKPTRRINALKGGDGLLLHSVRELHQKARIVNTLWDSSPLSDLMDSLGIIVKPHANPFPRGYTSVSGHNRRHQ
jgi:hypothetical protein